MAVLLAGAAGLAVLDAIGNTGQHLTITDNITTTMTINATTNVVTDCFQSVSSTQAIDIQGTSPNNYGTEGPKACGLCTQFLLDIYKHRMDLEEAAQAANHSYTPQRANADLENEMISGGSSSGESKTISSMGPCTGMCFSNVVLGVTQNAALEAKTGCSVTNVITNNITQNIQGQIQASLKNQQDIFGQLGSIISSNNESISTNLASTMSQNVTNNFAQSLSQTMEAVQDFSMTGNSILADNIKQSFTGKMAGSMQVNNTVMDQLRQSASYSVAQSLLNKNDTIGDLSKDFLHVIRTMSNLLEELTTQILLIIAAVIAAVIMVVGSLYIFNKSFHGWANTAIKGTTNAEIVHFQRMRTDPEYRAQVEKEKLATLNAKQRHQINKIKAKAEAQTTQKVALSRVKKEEYEAKEKYIKTRAENPNVSLTSPSEDMFNNMGDMGYWVAASMLGN